MIHLYRAHFNLLELSKVCLHIQKVKDSSDGLEVSIFILDFLSSFWTWMPLFALAAGPDKCGDLKCPNLCHF